MWSPSASPIARFRDKDFETGINVVDNWSLMHACYFHSDVIRFNACHANVVDGKSLGNLAASPYQPDAWKSELAGDTLIQLLVDAQSTLVRIWAMEMLRSVHPEAGRTMKFSLLMKLLSSPGSQYPEIRLRHVQEPSETANIDGRSVVGGAR